MSSRAVFRAGVRDWIVQRASAVLLVIYLVIFGVILIQHQPLDLEKWQAIFHPIWFKIISVIAFLCVVTHSWVGIWTIFTDYVHPWKLRFLLMSAVLLLLLAYFIWFIQIIWGV